MPTKRLLIALYILAGVAIVLAAFIHFETAPPPNGKYTALAQCIAASSAKFYGAFWCPHCAAQKALFGSSVKLLPYVECSTPNGQGQLPVCNDKQITGYPTWIFADGTRQSGEIPLATLAEKTMCELPKE